MRCRVSSSEVELEHVSAVQDRCCLSGNRLASSKDVWSRTYAGTVTATGALGGDRFPLVCVPDALHLAHDTFRGLFGRDYGFGQRREGYEKVAVDL